MVLDGLVSPKASSKPPIDVVVLSSAVVEKDPENTASRLTADPERTFFHSDLGKGGNERELRRDHEARLMSAV